jgi:hypothetical protein
VLHFQTLQDTAEHAGFDAEATAEAEDNLLAAAVAVLPTGEVQLAAMLRKPRNVAMCKDGFSMCCCFLQRLLQQLCSYLHTWQGASKWLIREGFQHKPVPSTACCTLLWADGDEAADDAPQPPQEREPGAAQDSGDSISKQLHGSKSLKKVQSRAASKAAASPAAAPADAAEAPAEQGASTAADTSAAKPGKSLQDKHRSDLTPSC